jgi:glycosyltransferase involved in cell wall biosynthesis
MRVCFLTHYFPPEPGAPQARIAGLARGLARGGVRVTVHTGFPHYPDGRITRPYANRPWTVEEDGRIRVVRSAVLPLRNRGLPARLADHAAFAAGALATRRVAGRQDVVVAESPPLLLAGAGVAYARSSRARLVVNVADLWPASAVALEVVDRRQLVAAAERLETFAYRRAAAITTPTAGLERILAAHPAAKGRVHRIAPVIDMDRVPDRPLRRRSGPLRAAYLGTIGLAQRIGTLVEAALQAGPDAVEVTIAGSGAQAALVRELVERRRATNVHLVGVVGPEAIRRLYEEAEVVAVLLRDVPLMEDALPTKLVEAMLAGRPVVLSARGECADHVQRSAGGIVVPPEDPAALADAFRVLRSRRDELPAMGERARRHAAAELGPEAAIERWGALLSDVAARGPASPQDVARRAGDGMDGSVVHAGMEREAEQTV